ncbi:MAG: ATP-binding protein [Bacteroidetes bacterium]|nr:ATP-binding protein [Bacteroidota bacterium]
MKFYTREKEIAQLKEIQRLSLKNAQFTVVTGRRRIGKTHLLLNATEGQPTLYFFVAREAESFLCQDFKHEPCPGTLFIIDGGVLNLLFHRHHRIRIDGPFTVKILCAGNAQGAQYALAPGQPSLIWPQVVRCCISMESPQW